MFCAVKGGWTNTVYSVSYTHLQNDLYFNLNTGNEEMSQYEINLIQQVDEAKLTPDTVSYTHLPGKEYGMVIDYIGIRDNMREAMKVYGGDTSDAPTADDVEQATSVFREEHEVLKNMFTGYDLSPFLNLECDPIERYRFCLLYTSSCWCRSVSFV